MGTVVSFETVSQSTRLVTLAVSDGSSFSSSPVTALLNVLMPRPNEEPISGSRFAPKTKRMTTRIISSSVKPNGPTLIMLPYYEMDSRLRGNDELGTKVLASMITKGARGVQCGSGRLSESGFTGFQDFQDRANSSR